MEIGARNIIDLAFQGALYRVDISTGSVFAFIERGEKSFWRRMTSEGPMRGSLLTQARLKGAYRAAGIGS